MKFLLFLLLSVMARVFCGNDIISHDTRVTVSADTTGNLGHPQVVIQNPPGGNWLKDRWQAASDMGGTAIPGEHYITLDFNRFVRAYHITLDWEAAYAKDYHVSVRSSPHEEWKCLFDGASPDDHGRRSVTQSGQSPGVTYTLPLHIIHNIDISQFRDIDFRYLQVFIRKPAAGWGVSLWQVEVRGTEW